MTQSANNYLWDRSGHVDPAIAELERILAPLAHHGTLPAQLLARPARSPIRRSRAFAVAAAVLLAGAALYLAFRPTSPRGPQSWTIERQSGNVAIADPQPIKGPGGETGQWIETGPDATAQLSGLAGGVVHISPESRVRIFDLGKATQRLELSRGSIYTEQSATGGPIEISTAAGTATLAPGTVCMISFKQDGRGAVEVKTGTVDFRNDSERTRLASFCTAELAQKGVGTPRSGTASPGFAGALARFDQARSSGDMKSAAITLADVLKSAAATDEVSLWNLMWRTDADGRKRILSRARQLGGVVVKVNDDALFSADENAMETWWNIMQP